MPKVVTRPGVSLWPLGGVSRVLHPRLLCVPGLLSGGAWGTSYITWEGSPPPHKDQRLSLPDLVLLSLTNPWPSPRGLGFLIDTAGDITECPLKAQGDAH